MLEVRTALENIASEEAKGVFWTESDEGEFDVEGDTEARGVLVEAIAVGFDDLERSHGEILAGWDGIAKVFCFYFCW